MSATIIENVEKLRNNSILKLATNFPESVLFLIINQFFF